MAKRLTRREFLKTTAAGFALTAAGCTGKVVWPAPGSEKGTVRLAFYTDVHARTEWDTPKAMARAARAINGQKADLVLAGGDLITDGFQSSKAKATRRWDAYMAMHRMIEGDLFPAIGNHDLVAAAPQDGTPPSGDPRAVFRDRMGLANTYYAFDAVGYHFVMLDAIRITEDNAGYQGMIWPEQLEWLKQDLSRVPRGMPIVVTTHIPILSAFYAATMGATYAPKKNRVVVNNREVLELIQDHNVILVLQGHLHAKEMIRWRNTTFIVGGAVSGKWWRGPWHGTEEGFNIVTLSENRVEWEYVDYGWEARRP